jgi:hypothetical protein
MTTKGYSAYHALKTSLAWASKVFTTEVLKYPAGTEFSFKIIQIARRFCKVINLEN